LLALLRVRIARYDFAHENDASLVSAGAGVDADAVAGPADGPVAGDANSTVYDPLFCSS
jgi:hypothetical protein